MHSRTTVRPWSLLVLVVLLATACSGAITVSSPSTTQAPSAGATSAPTIAPPSTAPASATPAPTGPQPLPSGALAGGTYGSVGFQPPLTLTVPEGAFSAVKDAATHLELEGQALNTDKLIFMRPTNWLRKGQKSLFAALHERHVPIGKEKPITVGGLTGSVAEFTVNPARATGGQGLPLVTDAEGTYFAGPLEHDRLIVLRDGDDVLLILAASPSEDEYKTFGPVADDVLKSLEIGQ